MIPTAKINTREKNEKKTMIRDFVFFLTFTYKYNQMQLSQYLLLHDIVYPTCYWHLLFVLVSCFFCSAKQCPYVVIWLLFFLWIVSVRCISLFVCWLGCSRRFFQKRPEDNFIFEFDIVNFDYFDISIHQQVISHSSGQLNDE